MTIFEAVQSGDESVVHSYLKYGGDVNHTIKTGSTLLMIAATYGQTDVMRVLIGAGAEVNVVNYDGMTALMYSMMKTSHIGAVQLLIDSGADVNAAFTRSNSAGTTALLLSASIGRSEITKLLVRSGADIHWKDNEGETALSLAVRFGHEETANLLRSSGA